METVLKLGDLCLSSRLILGTAMYPSPEIMRQAILAAGCDLVTVSLRRQAPDTRGGNAFWQIVKSLGVHVLPNTAGCRSAEEAVQIAWMAREIFDTKLIKLEVVADDYNLEPDPFELIKAAERLVCDGFTVLPYTTADFAVAKRLVEVGCRAVMPWASPIGSGRGLADVHALRTMRTRLSDVTLLVDAGLRVPSQAAQVMELGFDGIILNSAVARALDPAGMAHAFKLAVQAGHAAFLCGPMEQRDHAHPSTPVVGTPFWHQVKTN
jgi:thiazole synthase